MFQPVQNINILHLIVTVSACITALPLLREARGRALPAGRLFGGVPFALGTAVLLLAMATPETRGPQLWLAGLAAGAALGGARGFFVKLQVDRMYSRLRLPNGRDGFGAACTLVLFKIFAIFAPLVDLSAPLGEVGATGLVAACAGYLTGRAAAIWRRSQTAPHQFLRPTTP
jgi:hypothetical protein